MTTKPKRHQCDGCPTCLPVIALLPLPERLTPADLTDWLE